MCTRQKSKGVGKLYGLNQRPEKCRGETIKECNRRLCDFSLVTRLKQRVLASHSLCSVEGGGSARSLRREAHHERQWESAWSPHVELRACQPEDHTGSGWQKQSKEHGAAPKNKSILSFLKEMQFLAFTFWFAHIWSVAKIKLPCSPFSGCICTISSSVPSSLPCKKAFRSKTSRTCPLRVSFPCPLIMIIKSLVHRVRLSSSGKQEACN